MTHSQDEEPDVVQQIQNDIRLVQGKIEELLSLLVSKHGGSVAITVIEQTTDEERVMVKTRLSLMHSSDS